MNPALAHREITLAGVALLGAILALALASPRGPHATSRQLTPAYAPEGGWYTALAGARPMPFGRRTNCGVLLKPSTRGVIDSVLPCNVKLFVSFGSSDRVLTQVIARRPVVPGRRFDLTPALAEGLGIHANARIRWVYAK